MSERLRVGLAIFLPRLAVANPTIVITDGGFATSAMFSGFEAAGVEYGVAMAKNAGPRTAAPPFLAQARTWPHSRRAVTKGEVVVHPLLPQPSHLCLRDHLSSDEQPPTGRIRLPMDRQ